MSPARRGAPALLVLAGLAMPAAACELVLSEHRSGRELLRLPLDAAQPAMRIAFVHSVLGTPVVDLYHWRADPANPLPGAPLQAHVVQERFEGEGYGLPQAAAAGERLERDGAGWRLSLDRPVVPLVVRPLPAQQMQLLGPGEPVLLASLSAQAIEFTARDCPVAVAAAA